MAGEFASPKDYLAALTLCDVLVAAGIEHYFTIETGYLIFSSSLFDCIDALDKCITEAEGNREIRQRAFKSLFAICQFSMGVIS